MGVRWSRPGTWPAVAYHRGVMTEVSGVSATINELAGRFLADAADVDAADALPAEHVRGLADAGLYGVFAPVPDGGLGLTQPEVWPVVEELASACLASAFVWIQHFGLLGALLDPAAPARLRAELLPGAIRGEVRGGLALAGLLPGPPRLTATPVAGGWRLDGQAPWVTGWGVVNLLLVAARGPQDSVVRLLVDATGPAGTRRRPAAARRRERQRHGPAHLRRPGGPGREVRRPAARSTRSASSRRGCGPTDHSPWAWAAAAAPSSGPPRWTTSSAGAVPSSTPPRPAAMPAARARASAFAVRAAQILTVPAAARPRWPATPPTGSPARPRSCSCSGAGQQSGKRCSTGSRDGRKPRAEPSLAVAGA